MKYTVAEVAEKVGLSKVSVYSKLKSDELKPHIEKIHGITYISEVGLKLIKDSLIVTVNDLTQSEQEQPENAENTTFKEDLNLTIDYVNHLKEENERLWAELNEKNVLLSNLSRLVENGQVLLKDRQEEKQAELLHAEPEPKEEVKEETKEGFFARLFKK